MILKSLINYTHVLLYFNFYSLNVNLPKLIVSIKLNCHLSNTQKLKISEQVFLSVTLDYSIAHESFKHTHENERNP